MSRRSDSIQDPFIICSLPSWPAVVMGPCSQDGSISPAVWLSVVVMPYILWTHAYWKFLKTLDSSEYFVKTLKLPYPILIPSVKYPFIHFMHFLPASRHRNSKWQRSWRSEGSGGLRPCMNHEQKTWSQCHIVPPSVRLSLFSSFCQVPHSPAFANSCLSSRKKYCWLRFSGWQQDSSSNWWISNNYRKNNSMSISRFFPA